MAQHFDQLNSPIHICIRNFFNYRASVLGFGHSDPVFKPFRGRFLTEEQLNHDPWQIPPCPQVPEFG
jgi:hypothetical protein